jgi:hypothetical protein
MRVKRLLAGTPEWVWSYLEAIHRGIEFIVLEEIGTAKGCPDGAGVIRLVCLPEV